MNINMLADNQKDDYRGVFINEKSEERSVAVAVIICNNKQICIHKNTKFGIKYEFKRAKANLTLGSGVEESLQFYTGLGFDWTVDTKLSRLMNCVYRSS